MNERKIDEELAREVHGRVENCTDEEKQILWDKIKSELKEYDSFIGTIFFKAHYGVFLDIGKEFPVLLRITDMKNMNSKTYHNDYMNDKMYNLGEKLEVYFLNMHEHVGDIVVTDSIKD